MSGNVLGLAFKKFHGPKIDETSSSLYGNNTTNMRKRDSFTIELSKLLEKDNANEIVAGKVC